MFSDIWFDLFVGHVETDEEGEQTRKVDVMREARISTFASLNEIDDAHRAHLHRLLDKVIDDTNRLLLRMATHGRK